MLNLDFKMIGELGALLYSLLALNLFAMLVLGLLVWPDCLLGGIIPHWLLLMSLCA
jgi:hypothetical protein